MTGRSPASPPKGGSREALWTGGAWLGAGCVTLCPGRTGAFRKAEGIVEGVDSGVPEELGAGAGAGAGAGETGAAGADI